MASTAQPHRLAPGRSARRRRITNRVAELSATAAALLAVVVLAVVFVSVFKRGLEALDLDFFTKTPAVFGESGGGIAQAFVGSLVIVGVATVLVIPVGVAIAVYVAEFAGPGCRVRCDSRSTSSTAFRRS